MTPEENQKCSEARLDYENLMADAAERVKFQAEFAHAIFRGLMLVNGGAIVALFTFIGNSTRSFDPSKIWWAFGLFVVGLVCTLVAMIAAFFSQSFYMKSSLYQAWTNQRVMLSMPHVDGGKHDHVAEYRRGERAEFGAVVFVGLALAAFFVGSGFALSAVL
jgi:hypothetical protein